jgi:hypothetical protein
VLAIGLTVRDMLHKLNEAASFALVNRVDRAVDRGQTNHKLYDITIITL